MKILVEALFDIEFENFLRLRMATGPINERIILLVDRTREINSVTNFIVNTLKDFSLDITEEDRENIVKHFTINEPNYYSVKEYIIKSIEDIVKERELENEIKSVN